MALRKLIAKNEGLHTKFNVIASWYVAKFSRDIYLPALPAIALTLSSDQHHIQMVVAVYFSALALSRFIWTPLSDMYGRRKIVLIALPIFLFGSLLCLFAWEFWSFAIGRTLQGFGIGRRCSGSFLQKS